MASQNWCFIGKVLQRKLELEKVVFLVTFHRSLSEKWCQQRNNAFM